MEHRKGKRRMKANPEVTPLFTMIRILQINLGECRVAHDFMLATAEQTATDVILVSEPNKALCDGLESCYMDQGRRAAIIVNNKNLWITKVGPGDNTGFRWI